METKDSFFNLPDEILIEIYRKLKLDQQIQILSTSKQIRHLLGGEEKNLDNVKIDFYNAIDIQSHYLPKIGREYEIYPHVFISVQNDDLSDDLANIKIEIKNYNQLYCMNRGVEYKDNDAKIIKNRFFIQKDHIQFHNYQLYTFTYKHYYYILYIHGENFFLWRTEHLIGWKPTYIYKFISKKFDHNIKKFEVLFFQITLDNGEEYYLDVTNFSLIPIIK